MDKEFLKILEEHKKLKQLALTLTLSTKGEKIDPVAAVMFSKAAISIFGVENYRKKNTISLRIGAIAITEEMIIEKNEPNRDNLTYSIIINQTKVRFSDELRNREMQKFDTVQKIHPQYPCRFYDSNTNDSKINISNGRKRGAYKDAIVLILSGSSWILKNKKAVITLGKTYDNVINC